MTQPPDDHSAGWPPEGGQWLPDNPAIAHDEYGYAPAGYGEPPYDGAGYGGRPDGEAAYREGSFGEGPYRDTAYAGNGTTGGNITQAGNWPDRPTGEEDARRAMLAYLTVPFFAFLPSLVVYLLSRRTSRWTRAHASQAVNVSITGLLYDLSGVIMGAMLALDTPAVSVLIMVPLAAILWLITLSHLVRAARAAAGGGQYAFPSWLCMPIVR